MCLLVCTVFRGNSHILPHWVLKNKSVRWAKTGIISLILNKLKLRLIGVACFIQLLSERSPASCFPPGDLEGETESRQTATFSLLNPARTCGQ